MNKTTENGPGVMTIELGNTALDNQLGNFYNALDQLVCYYRYQSPDSERQLAKMLNLYTDGIIEGLDNFS